MENTALLIIDVQNDYFPGGKMTLDGVEEAGEKVRQILEYFRENKLPVIHIQHIDTSVEAAFFLPGTYGAEISPLVSPQDNEKVIIKHYPNSFRETCLVDYLKEKNISSLIITGMMTDVCVDATTRAAFDLGFNNIVIANATATMDRELCGRQIKASEIQQSFLAGMAALKNLYARIITAEEFLIENDCTV